MYGRMPYMYENWMLSPHRYWIVTSGMMGSLACSSGDALVMSVTGATVVAVTVPASFTAA